MNLKDGFRFMNVLQEFIRECETILSTTENVVTVKKTFHHSKVDPNIPDQVCVEVNDCPFSDHVNDLIRFAMYLLEQKERLTQAIYEAKCAMSVNLDGAISLNTDRRALAKVLSTMSHIRNTDTTSVMGGNGYRFNAEGNQVAYRCDVQRVVTINFDRGMTKTTASGLNKAADEASAQIDSAMINTTLAFEPPFDVNDSFEDVFSSFLEKHPG